jgi:uncharacterized protein (TIGR03000 family)
MVRGLLLKFGLTAVLGVFLFVDPPKAQAWDWVRGYGGLGYYGPGWYGGYGGYYGPGYYYGWTYPPAHNWTYPYAYSGWYWPNFYGYYSGSYAYYPGMYYPTGSPYSYYGTNYAPRYELGVNGSSRTYGYAPDTSGESEYYGTMPSVPDTAALISVKVPPDAVIWFDNHKTKQTGPERRFVTPSLDPDRNFSYEVRAQWMENNRQVEETKKVTIHSGEQSTVDFTARPVRSAEQLKP